MPAASRSTISSRMASATWLAVVAERLVVAHERPREDRHRAGEHALDRLARSATARTSTQSTVIGCGPGRRRRTGSAGARSGSRRTAPSRSAVAKKPSSCSAKYCTMSLRSGSPCTSTSRPSSSCSAMTSAISAFIRVVVARRRRARPLPQRGAGLADLRRSAGTSRSSSSAAAAGSAARPARPCGRANAAAVERVRGRARRRGRGPRRRRDAGGRRRADATASDAASALGDRVAALGAVPSASVTTSVDLLVGERQPAAQRRRRARSRRPASYGTCSSEQEVDTATGGRTRGSASARASPAPRRGRCARCCGRRHPGDQGLVARPGTAAVAAGRRGDQVDADGLDVGRGEHGQRRAEVAEVAATKIAGRSGRSAGGQHAVRLGDGGEQARRRARRSSRRPGRARRAAPRSAPAAASVAQQLDVHGERCRRAGRWAEALAGAVGGLGQQQEGDGADDHRAGQHTLRPAPR